ncbi:tetratricopeptide repeat protein [Flavobacterium sp.]|uniref:tetratricopeptide repeat protein n=1 Tax=Flavobacterium sp. TaxID=239 RepID=UPI0028BEBA50|nr:tetratricopeptide repeat protein [Flavobacterium sp.]
MKIKYLFVASSLMLSAASFAQKDEMKALKKLYAKDQLSTEDMSSYKANVNKLTSMTGLSESDLVYTNFYKAMLPVLELNDAMAKNPNDLQAVTKNLSAAKINAMASGLNEVLAFEKKSGKEVYTSDIKETIQSFKPMMLQYAYALNDGGKEVEAAKIFDAVYKLDSKDQVNLYNASVLAMNAKDYDYALTLLEELKNVKYTGEGTNYLAINKTSKKEELFPDKNQRDLFVKSGTHEKPRDEKIASKKGEIYKNYALILVEKGKVEEAKKAVAEARQQDPNDTGLIMTEANLYYQTKDMESYKRLIGEALAKKPNDADLLFNLGVVSGNAGDVESAKKYYEKAISIDPKYFNAYNNLGLLLIADDQKIVSEMNSLGMSTKDAKKYDELKAKRQKMLTQAIPYFEKALDLQPANEGVKNLLLGAYQFLEMDAKYKALKAK